MTYNGLISFIAELENQGELHRIKTFVDPLLEITEVTDRIVKSGGKALLFENTGTSFPILINAFGSEKRITMALGNKSPDAHAAEIEKFSSLTKTNDHGFIRKLSALPGILKLASCMPLKTRKKGLCQQIINSDPDLSVMPVLKCWPHDGGRFITLPIVHTYHPDTKNPNAGMYRMQVLGTKSAAVHWQRHKTGAVHFEAWKKAEKIMPVSVALGGDPVYTYCATAPLPENISEYILAGFLRGKRVRLVKCITNDIYVPYDADFVIEGYIDPSEDMILEGPFGDHTGFYSLADWYPKMHITCITHSINAVFPATIVGVPPHEDAWLTKATEKIFLSPMKLALLSEIEDLHMPDPGVAHNLVIVKIRKTYPGQGMKSLYSLFGAGQMMFTKYLVVVSGDVGIRDYIELLKHVFINTNPVTDIVFTRGPLDVLDHSSDTQSFGGKAGIDATVKFSEEKLAGKTFPVSCVSKGERPDVSYWFDSETVRKVDYSLLDKGVPVIIVSVKTVQERKYITELSDAIERNDKSGIIRLIIVVDEAVDPEDHFMVAWQVLGNSDPVRDHTIISSYCMLLDGTIKLYPGSTFPRKWPNVVCSLTDTVRIIDNKWDTLGFTDFIRSPSLYNIPLCRKGNDEIDTSF